MAERFSDEDREWLEYHGKWSSERSQLVIGRALTEIDSLRSERDEAQSKWYKAWADAEERAEAAEVERDEERKVVAARTANLEAAEAAIDRYREALRRVEQQMGERWLREVGWVVLADVDLTTEEGKDG